MTTGTTHLGRKISRIRELRGMKQEALAAELGVSQQAVSKLEQSEHVDDEKLEMIAKVLQVTPTAIKNFNEDAVINNNIYDQHNTVINYQFNPIEKYVEMVERNTELYERLLKTEREKIALLEKMLNH